jgi:hypothetical protein
MLMMVGSKIKNLNNSGMWNSLLPCSFQKSFLCFELFLKNDEESSSHVDNNLLILLKKYPNSIDHVSVEVLVILQEL